MVQLDSPDLSPNVLRCSSKIDSSSHHLTEAEKKLLQTFTDDKESEKYKKFFENLEFSSSTEYMTTWSMIRLKTCFYIIVIPPLQIHAERLCLQDG